VSGLAPRGVLELTIDDDKCKCEKPECNKWEKEECKKKGWHYSTSPLIPRRMPC